jgi:hypothetical protein
MISHYYLQRTEERTARHRGKAEAYFAEKGVAMSCAMMADVDDLSVADVESAKPSAAFMSNVIIEKKRRQRRTGGGEDTP